MFVAACCLIFSSYHASEQTLDVLVAVQNPPYMIDIELQQGIDLEIIALIHREMGYKTRFVQGHFRRQGSMFESPDIDAMSTWVTANTENCHTSNPYRHWLNAVMVSQDGAIDDVEALSGHTIATFHGAEAVLNNFSQITSNIKSMEVAENSMQAAHMIKANRVSAYLGDYVAFYYALRAKYSKDTADRFSKVIHYFDKSEQLICYKDPNLTNQFNEALSRLNDAGKIDAIIHRYVDLPDSHSELSSQNKTSQ